MIWFIFLIAYYLRKFAYRSECFNASYKVGEETCSSCAYTHYYNGSEGNPSPFPKSQCLPKLDLKMIIRVLVLAPGSVSDCSDCKHKSIIVKENLYSTLIEMSNSCQLYTSCDIGIFLEFSKTPQVIADPETNNRDLFRRANTKILIEPLPCGIIDARISCNAEGIQQVLIRAPRLRFFISGSFYIRNIYLDGADLFIENFGSVDLQKSPSIVCTQSKIESPQDPCYLGYKTVSLNIDSRSYGIFNLEPIIDMQQFPIPSLIIDSCKITNIYAVGKSDNFFTCFISTAGFSLFNLTLNYTLFESNFFPQGLLNTNLRISALNNDPVYRGFTDDYLAILAIGNIPKHESTLLYIKNVTVNKYNNYLVKASTNSPATVAVSCSLFCLVESGLLDIYFENVNMTNITNNSEDQLYMIYILHLSKNPNLYIRTMFISNILYSTFLLVQSSNMSDIRSIIISDYIFSGGPAIIHFQNVSQINILTLRGRSIISQVQKSPLVSFTDCVLSNLKGFILDNLDSLAIEIFKNTFLQARDIIYTDCAYSSYLFKSEGSIFTLDNVSLSRVIAKQPTNHIIFSFKSPVFNLTSIYINCISGEAILDYKDAQNVYLNDFYFENNTSIRTFFLGSTAFYSTQINNLTIKNCILPRFAEFISYSFFSTYTPALQMVGLIFSNLTLPATNADIFAGFSKMDVVIKDSVFDSVKRIDIGPATPIGILAFSRLGGIDIYNCSFKAVGYSFTPRNLQVSFNYPLILIAYLMKYTIRSTVFESDETVSLNQGFIFSGQVYIRAEITNCKFFVRKKNPNFVYNGVRIINTIETILVNNSFSNISCTPYHMFNHQLRSGPVTIHGEDTLSFIKNTKTLVLKNLFFENCFCENGGGLHVANYHYITIDNIHFYNNKAFVGGSWGLVSSSEINASNITVMLSYSSVEAASILFSNIVKINILNYKELFTEGYNSGSWKIENSNLFCNDLTIFNTSSQTIAGFCLLFSSSLTVSQGTIFNTTAKQYGGCFFTTMASRLSLINVSIEISEALYGGFISGDDARVINITDVFVSKVKAYLNGACLYYELVALSVIKNLSVFEAVSNSNGIIHIKSSEESSSTEIYNLICKQNSAVAGSCVYFLSSSQLIIDGITIADCTGVAIVLRNEFSIKTTINNLKANDLKLIDSLINIDGLIVLINKVSVFNNVFYKNVISVKLAEVKLDNITFTNNSKSDKSAFSLVYANLANLTMNQIFFINIDNVLASLLTAESCNIYFFYSYFESGNGGTGLISVEKSYFHSFNLLFIRNKIPCLSISYGDVVMKYVQFIDNQGGTEELPSDIHIKNKNFFSSTVILENISSSKSYPGYTNMFQNFLQLKVENCMFLSSQNKPVSSNLYQGTLISNVHDVKYENSSFCGFAGKLGPALRVLAEDDFKSNLSISNSRFTECLSISGGGGAVSFLNLVTLSIISSVFVNNRALYSLEHEEGASGRGGCGLIHCYNYLNRKCLINIRNNAFISNFADIYGPLFVSNSSIQKEDYLINENNSDSVSFTNSSAVFPPELFLALPNSKEPLSESITLNSSIDVTNKSLYNMKEFNKSIVVKSGDLIDIEIILSDKKGEILIFDNKSTCSIENPLFIPHLTVIANGFAVANKGKFIFKNLAFLNIPNSSTQVIFSIKVPRNMIINSEPYSVSFTINLYFAPCLPGEVITSDFSCFRCPEGSFSFLDPMENFKPEEVSSNPQKCELCSEKAVCPGGRYDFPRPGFWRPKENSYLFQECMITEACEGPGNYSQIDRLGKCAEGHFGNLCHDCMMNYGKVNQNFACEPCKDSTKGILSRLVLVTIALFAYAISGSYMYSIETNKIYSHGYILVFMKIGLNFAQVINLVSFIKFKWILPSLKKFFSASSNSISLATEDVLLNDCVLQEYFGSVENLYAYKVLLIVFLPVIFGVLTSSFWFLQYGLYLSWLTIKGKIKRKKAAKKAFFRRLLASAIISIFLFHPLIIRSCLSLLNCFQVNEEDPSTPTFLFISPSFLCWTPFHMKVVVIFAVPGIFVWGILFPIILMYTLVKQQELNSINNTGRNTVKKFASKKSVQIYAVDQDSIEVPQENEQNKVIPSIALFSNFVEDKFFPDHSEIRKNSKLTTSKRTKNSIFHIILKSNIFKFLYYGYKDEYHYWECINFLKKLLISVLINMNRMIGYDIVVLLLLFLFFVSFWMQLKYKPFIRNDLNFMELISLLSIFLIFASIVFLATNIPTSMLYFLGFLIVTLYMLLCFFTFLFVANSIKEFKIFKAIWEGFKSSLSTTNSTIRHKPKPKDVSVKKFHVKPSHVANKRVNLSSKI